MGTQASVPPSRTQIQAFETLISQEGTSGGQHPGTPAHPPLLGPGLAPDLSGTRTGTQRDVRGQDPGVASLPPTPATGWEPPHPSSALDHKWEIRSEAGPLHSGRRVHILPPQAPSQPGSALRALKRSQETPVQRMKWGGSLRRGRQAGLALSKGLSPAGQMEKGAHTPSPG